MGVRRTSLAIAVALLAGAGCAGNADQGQAAPDEIGRKSDAVRVPAGLPYIGFGGYYGFTSVALTFDDGPDAAGVTGRVLDALKSRGVHATFFVNSNNACNLATDTACRAALRRIYAEGHAVGNHTAHHYDCNQTWVDVDGELRRVESVVRGAVSYAPPISLTRMPYGNPFIAGPQWRMDEIGWTVAAHGVHVGWSIDADDWDCATATCVKNNVFRQLDAGRRGIILLHAIHAPTAAAVTGIIDGIHARGLSITSVEHYVNRKYGESSYSLMLDAR